MASFIGHGVVAYTISKMAKEKTSKKLLFVAILSAMLPDIDVIGFYIGIPYESMFGHRGITHSILFAFLWSLLLSKTIFRHSFSLAFPVIITCTLSHGIIDALTTGGRGIGFFIPVSSERFFFPARFIQVSPLHISDFFGEWGIAVVRSELLYLGIPCAILLICRSIYLSIQ